VSVVVTFRNAGPYISDMVKSVFAQTVEDWELLLFDDGSEDDAGLRLSKVRDDRVSVRVGGRHRGTAVRRNELTAAARGKYLAVMDADDVMHPRRLERQLRDLEASGADVTGGGMYTVDPGLRVTGIVHPRSPASDLRGVLRHGHLFHGTALGHCEWFASHPYDPQFVRAQDYDLWCRTYSDSHFSVVDLPMIFYRRPEEVDIAKYRRSCRANREVAGRHGETLGRPYVAWMQSISYLKEGLALLVNGTGVGSERLLGHGKILSAEDLRDANRALEIATQVEVPGW